MNGRSGWLLMSKVPERRSQRSFDTPAITHPMEDAISTDTKSYRPLRYRLRNAVACHQSGVTSVVDLFAFGSPSNILGEISEIVIDPINAMRRRWASSDIVQERFVTISPALAYCDASTTVVRIGGMAGVQTPTLDVFPSTEFRGTCVPVSANTYSPTLRRAVSGTARPFRMAAERRTACRTCHFSLRRELTSLRAETGSLGAVASDRERFTASLARQNNARRILSGHRVTSGVSPRSFARRWGTLLPSNCTRSLRVEAT